jgi:hypothetical protein
MLFSGIAAVPSPFAQHGHRMTDPGLHLLGQHAQQMAKNCNSERMAMAFQWVAIGSILIMAGAAAVHLFKDVTGAWRKEPAPRDYWQLREELDRLHERQQGRSR